MKPYARHRRGRDDSVKMYLKTRHYEVNVTEMVQYCVLWRDYVQKLI